MENTLTGIKQDYVLLENMIYDYNTLIKLDDNLNKDSSKEQILFTTKNPIVTSTAASKIMLTPQWDISNATGKIEVCNNGFDASPAWEDMTTEATSSTPYLFKNSTKTADKWGILIRITMVRNEDYTGEVAIYGFGGAYE